MNDWLILNILDSVEMPADTLNSFNFVIDKWGIDNNLCSYVGWVISDLNFNKSKPDYIDLCKITVDDWLIDSKKIPNKENATVLIKLTE